jgi:hypothetical protein
VLSSYPAGAASGAGLAAVGVRLAATGAGFAEELALSLDFPMALRMACLQPFET